MTNQMRTKAATLKHTLPLLTALLLTPLAALHAAAAAKPARPMVLAAYYCWYHTGDHPQKPWLHWTYPESETNALALKARRPGEPTIASAARPLAGFYDSADTAIAEWHVRLAKAAAIDAFLVDWWDTVSGLDKTLENGILAAAEKQNFKIALLDERAQFRDKLDDYQSMLTRALRKYKDSPAYLRLDGKPVVHLYQVAQKPGLTPADFTALSPNADGYLICFGIAPDKLFQTIQLKGGTNAALTTHALNRGVKYAWRVDAFNASGIAQGPALRAE